MMKPQRSLKFILIVSFAFLSACASKSNKGEKFLSVDSAKIPSNSISINYALRHNVYLFELESKADTEFSAKSVVNEKQIEKRKISRENYISFANRIYEFAEKYKESSVSDDDCKSPFMIRMEKDGQASEVRGCRSNDNSGELGKIIREGEILFYAE